ncbi:MAG: hypothetical protein EXS18_03385 [Verrucomicrobiae bacterium]|nr:hypothetical protein [Verrucomicrobiae bacterium]
MKSVKRFLLVLVIEVVVLVLLHTFLIHWLSAGNVVAVILAGGAHTPKLMLATAGLFLLVRLFAVLFLPGFLLARVGQFLFERYSKSRVKSLGDEHDS